MQSCAQKLNLMRNLFIPAIAMLSIASCCPSGDCDDTLDVPANYEFTDADGNSTVSYSGQHQRLNMLSEMTTYMKSANTEGVAVDAATLHSMYANEEYTWLDEEELGMTGSSKQLKSKTAGGDPTITAEFEALMSEMAAASEGAKVGSVVVSTTNPEKQYLQSNLGHEWTQLIEKGLMGACFYYNISSVYLSSEKMDVDNTLAVDSAAGKYYTVMEHHWDEAYGYFTTAVDYPVNGTDRFWGKYANGREDILGSASKISEAFRTGRAAISQGDLILRDEQISIIRDELELAAGGTAIHYLNEAVANFGDDALRNHALSEAKAFIEGLAYGANTSVDATSADEILAVMGEDFYAVTTASLIEARDMLAEALGLTEHAESL